MIYGNYAQQAPQAAIAEAVARGDLDLAVVWGPTAAYFARQQAVPLVTTPVTPWLDGPQWPMAFDISLGVRRDDVQLRQALDAALARHAEEIAALLAEFGLAPPDDTRQAPRGTP